MGAIFNVFPLILVPVLTYNIWAFGATASFNNGDGAACSRSIWRIRFGCNMPMASGAEWTIAFGDVLMLARADPCSSSNC